jgi:4-amino-4-deoxy-L-arabinose transferase-like glycosyltransferase
MSKTNCVPVRAFGWPTRGLPALFEAAVATNRRTAVVLALISLLAFLPGFFQIPPVDRDEPRYAQATKQMIETGDYVDIRFINEEANDKPVGIYWLQAAAVKTAEALGVHGARDKIWVYRLPSLIGAIGAVLATFWCALAFVDRRWAAIAALVMASSTLLGVEARLAKTDAMLLFSVTVAMGALARVYLATRAAEAKQPSLALVATFWTALAAGVLIKGLPILMIAGLTALVLSIVDRSARWWLALRPIAGIPWAALLVLPWLIAISMRTGGGFVLASVGHDTLGKILNSQQSHGAPPGLYLVLFFVTFFPASILAGLAVPAVVRSAWRRDPAVCFLLAWLVPSWIVFELAVTKLPHYVLPLYPAIAILLAIVVKRNLLSPRRWLVLGLVWWFLVPLIASVAVVGGAVALGYGPLPAAWPVLAAAIIGGYLAWRSYAPDGAERSIIFSAAASMLLSAGIYGLIIPPLGQLFPSAAMAGVLRQAGCAHPVAAVAGYEEPSLIFLAGSETVSTDGAGVADFLRLGGCRFGFVDTRQEASFNGRAQAIGLHYDRAPAIEAVNLGHVGRVTIAVFRAKEAP